MHSVYKLPISMAVMKHVDAGKIKLTDKITISKDDLVGRVAHSPMRLRHPNGATLTVEELLRFAISESDGAASDALMKLAGGPGAVQAYLTELSIKDMIVLDTEVTLTQNTTARYRNWATPEASVALLRALHERRGIVGIIPGPAVEVHDGIEAGAEALEGITAGGHGGRAQDGDFGHGQRSDRGDERYRHHYSAKWKTRGDCRLRFRLAGG